MAEYLHPGVYVEEVSSGVRPIEGVGTSTAGFIGITAKGIPHKAEFITSWSQFVRKFGDLIENSYLPYAVSQYFQNGGKKCYVVRVLNKASATTSSGQWFNRQMDGGAKLGLEIKAKGAGGWGDDLMIKIEDANTNPTREFKLIVYHEGSPVEVFNDLSMDPKAANHVETEINDISEFIEVKDKKAYDVKSAAKLEATLNLVGGVVPLNGDTLHLELPDGTKIDSAFGADVTPAALVSRLTADWGSKNITVSLDDPTTPTKLIISHNVKAYGSYFLLTATGPNTLGTGAGDALQVAAADWIGASNTAFPNSNPPKGPAAGAVLKSTVAAGSPPAITIGDGDTIDLTVTTSAGGAYAISEAFNAADNGGSTSWQPANIANHLEKAFRDNHNSILRVKTEGNRVVVETTNRGQNDSALQLTGVGGAANTNLDFNSIDYTGTSATGSGLSEPAFLQSDEGPFTLVKDANFYIVFNNKADGSEYTGQERVLVKLSDTHITNFLQVKTSETVNAINAAESENGVTIPNASLSNHIEAVEIDGRVVIRQKQRGNFYNIYVVDGSKSPNKRLKLQTQKQYGYVEGNAASPYYRPNYNLVSGVNEPKALTGGDDGSPPGKHDHLGDAADKTGLHALDDIIDVNFIAIPGQTDEGLIGDAIGYCDKRTDCVFIADSTGKRTKDTPLTEPVDVQDFVRNKITFKSSYGALYYPWMEISDSIGVGKNPKRFVPPSGFVAGLYARTDTTRGVWKAPAGTEAKLVGPLSLEYSVTDSEQDILNPNSVNCIREFPAAGTVIWGARTLSLSDKEWIYLPVRRYAIYLRVSIYRGTQWAVFEPNDETLWESLTANINDFMMGEFRKGALAGTTPDKAFSVKCDADLNPQSEIDAGRVNMEVKFAPLKPAEFVIIRISQKTQRPGG